MKKKVYHYEVELINNFMERLSKYVEKCANYMILKQNIDENHNYTYIGLEPKDYIYSDDNYLNIVNKTQYLTKKGDYLKHFVEWIDKNQIEIKKGLPPFIGGAMGFFSDTLYDYYNGSSYKSQTPHVCFMIFEELLIIDHNNNKLIFTFIGDYEKENFYNNRFLKMKLALENINVTNYFVDTSINFNFNEELLSLKYAKLMNKFSTDKFFIIKTAEELFFECKFTGKDLFFKIINDNNNENCAIFKSTDFTYIVVNNDYLNYENNELTVNNESLDLVNIQKDLLKNQIAKFKKIQKLSYSDQQKFKINCLLGKTNAFEILNNFKLFEYEYGIPFERNHNFIRRQDLNHNYGGILGYIGYNNNLFMLNIGKSIIFDNKKNSIIIKTNLNNEDSFNQYKDTFYNNLTEIKKIFSK